MILTVVLATCFLLHVGIADEVTPNYTMSRRIVGGDIVPDNKHPFMAGILITDGILPPTSSGGSIIADRWILTAAHFVKIVRASQITVYTGDNGYASGEQHLVQDVLAHPDYDGDNNDIALLHLKTTITKGTPVELATTYTSINTKCTIIGWGRTDRYQLIRSDSVLREVDVLTTPCKDIYLFDANNLERYNESSVLCTSTESGIGGCLGDAGGPLVIGNVQIGVVSTGVSCAMGVPDVFTKVAFYQEWIHNTMRDNN